MNRGKLDPGVSELPRGSELSRDHVNRPLGITGSCLQWNISRYAVTKGTVVLKSVMLTDLAFLSTSGLSEFSRVHGAQLLISFNNLWALYYFPDTPDQGLK